MSKEIKLGLFGILVITAVIIGYRFLAGENLLGSSKRYTVHVSDAMGLIRSSPIFYKGFQVGTVSDIAFESNAQNITSVRIELRIDEPIAIKKDAVALIFQDGIVGGKAIRLDINDNSTADILPNGGSLKGRGLNMLEAMIGSPEEISPYAQILKDGLVSAFDTISIQAKDPTVPGIGKMFYDMDIIMADMKVTMRNLNRLVKASNTHITTVFTDLAAVTGNLKASNTAITSIIDNTAGLTKKLNEAGLDSTIIGANFAIAKLKTTLNSTNTLLANLDQLVSKANQGDGTMAKLLNDPELYTELTKSTANLNLFLQDFRLNPKRYVNVSVFGKKQKKYVVPENDPATKE